MAFIVTCKFCKKFLSVVISCNAIPQTINEDTNRVILIKIVYSRMSVSTRHKYFKSKDYFMLIFKVAESTIVETF